MMLLLICYLHFFRNEVKYSLTELTTRSDCSQLFSVVCYISAYIGFLVLWVVELIHRCGGKEHFVCSV